MRKAGLVLLCFLGTPAWANGISQAQALQRAKQFCGDEFCGIAPSRHPHWEVAFVHGAWRARVMDDSLQSQQCGFVFEVMVPDRSGAKAMMATCTAGGDGVRS
jgi:hypothetical protein